MTDTDRPDLAALADRLESESRNITDGRVPRPHSSDLRTAARILRAVAAAPGPLRDPGMILYGEWHDGWNDWMDTLSDAVGEQ